MVVDCVTLWITNLLLRDETFGEAEAARYAEALAAAARVPDSTVIVVTNEVGSGVVPDNELARRFRDCAGRANQVIARAADEVQFLVSGIAVQVKPGKEGREWIKRINVRVPEVDRESRARAAERVDNLLMPRRALGRLLELGEKVAGITGYDSMDLSRKMVVVMAGDHGVTEEGVSAYPSEVTGQMVRGFAAGMAGINVLSRHAGIEVRVVDMGCGADLSDLVASGAVIDARVAAGTRQHAQGPRHERRAGAAEHRARGGNCAAAWRRTAYG